MAVAPSFPFLVEPLGKHHHRAAFSSGSPPLDHFLQHQAGQEARRHLAATFVLVDMERKVVGYYTLSATSIRLSELPAEVAGKLPRYPLVPATLLGRLAVDAGHQGKKLGEFLHLDALHRSLAQSQIIASMAVVVDAKGEQARSFYERYGFIKFPDQPFRLFLPTKTIARLFG